MDYYADIMDEFHHNFSFINFTQKQNKVFFLIIQP